MPDPITFLYNLLLTNLAIVADDGTTTLAPGLSVPSSAFSAPDPGTNASLIYVKQNPYPYEKDETGKIVWSGPQPLVMVGPRRGTTIAQAIGYKWSEVHSSVEIRILTRDWDLNEQGFTLDGRTTRTKILEAIKALVKTNAGNPDGQGTFNYMRISDAGKDSDIPEPNPLYITALGVEMVWLE